MTENADLFAEMQTIILEKIAALSLEGHWRPMYGGLMFELEPNIAKTGLGGVFISKKHISFEFSNGVLLDDPNKLLEGKGKFRRHLKLKNFNDIDDKNLCKFFTQAYKIQQDAMKK